MGCVCRMGELLLQSAGEGLPRSLWWLPASSACTTRGWGATGGGWGALWVGGAFVQYAQPLASRSRPSWSRPTRADSGRSRRRTMTTGPQRRRRPGSGGGGPMTEASGCAVGTPDSLLRGLVSTALTLPSLPANHPTEIVGILRFFLGEQSRLGVNVSAVDTDAPPDLFPSSCPRFQGHRPAQGSCPSECLRRHDTHMSQKRGDSTAAAAPGPAESPESPASLRTGTTWSLAA